MGGAIQLWLLQPDADLDTHRLDRHGTVPSAYMVQLLPHGHDDTGDLQAQAAGEHAVLSSMHCTGTDVKERRARMNEPNRLDSSVISGIKNC